MSLRKRVLTTLALTLAFLIVFFLISSYMVFFRSPSSHAQLDVYENVELVQDALDNELSQLQLTTSDWAVWDNAYNFINGTGSILNDPNISDNAFTGNNLNLMLFINSSGKMLFGKSFDLQAKKKPLYRQS